MNPNAPAANPTTSNTNQPYGGFGQAQSDYGSAKNILNFLPTQEASTTAAANNANTNTASILPNISINAPTYTAPTAQTVNAGSFGTNLTGYNQAVQGAEQALTSGENQTYSGAMGQLQSAESQYGNLTPVYQNLAASYGIPGYQNDIATLTGLLQNLNRDVNAQTTLGGGLMTESARDEMYNNQAQPLQQSLNSAGTFLQYGQNDVNNLLDTYEKSLSNALTPLQTNISNLPTLFGQTNEAAQAGYAQGQQSIQDTIQNQFTARQTAAQEEQANSFAREVAAQYGSGGGLGSVFSSGNNKGAGGQFGGVSFKNPQQGGAGGYAFAINGKPASAVQWAASNGQSPSSVIAYMAQNGDATAGQAYRALIANPNMSMSQLAAQFPSIAWGMQAPVAASKPASNNNSKYGPVGSNGIITSGQYKGMNTIAAGNLQDMSTPSVWNLWGML